MTLSLRDIEENEAWQQNIWRSDDPGPEPPVSEWMGRVRAYCNAKGLRCEMFVQDNFDMTKTISWETR